MPTRKVPIPPKRPPSVCQAMPNVRSSLLRYVEPNRLSGRGGSVAVGLGGQRRVGARLITTLGCCSSLARLAPTTGGVQSIDHRSPEPIRDIRYKHEEEGVGKDQEST